MTERATQVLTVIGSSCALCGTEGGPGLHVPVFGPDGARMPRLCQPCLSVVSGVLLQLLGHASAQVAAIAVSMNGTGHPPVS